MQLKECLIMGRTVKFYSLIDVTGTYRENQVLVTFLSMLELAKIGFVSLFQAEALSEIHVTTLKSIDHNVIDRVEDYETGGEAGNVQSSLFDEPEKALSAPIKEVDLSFEDNENETDESEQEQLSFNHEVKVVQAQPQDEALPEEVATDDDIAKEEELLKMAKKDESL